MASRIALILMKASDSTHASNSTTNGSNASDSHRLLPHPMLLILLKILRL